MLTAPVAAPGEGLRRDDGGGGNGDRCPRVIAATSAREACDWSCSESRRPGWRAERDVDRSLERTARNRKGDRTRRHGGARVTRKAAACRTSYRSTASATASATAWHRPCHRPCRVHSRPRPLRRPPVLGPAPPDPAPAPPVPTVAPPLPGAEPPEPPRPRSPGHLRYPHPAPPPVPDGGGDEVPGLHPDAAVNPAARSAAAATENPGGTRVVAFMCLLWSAFHPWQFDR